MPNQSGPTTEAHPSTKPSASSPSTPSGLPATPRTSPFSASSTPPGTCSVVRNWNACSRNLRDLERLQRLQIVQDVYFGDENTVGALHDLPLYQQFAKRNSRPAPAAPARRKTSNRNQINRVRNEIQPSAPKSAATPPAPAGPAKSTSAAAASTLLRSSMPLELRSAGVIKVMRNEVGEDQTAHCPSCLGLRHSASTSVRIGQGFALLRKLF